MNTIASITPTPAFASINLTAGLPVRRAPGVGLALAGLASIALWTGMAQIVIALVA